jgi:Major Facilitator Superfamily
MQALAPQTAPDPRRWWALALLCGAFFMVILDAAIVTVALPSIQEELSFSARGLQWVVSAYALTFAGLLLLGGRAADLLGRRRVLGPGRGRFRAPSEARRPRKDRARPGRGRWLPTATVRSTNRWS